MLVAVTLAGIAPIEVGSAQPRAQNVPAAVDATKEKLISIPREGTPDGLLTRLCLTQVRSPAPLVVVNHGSPPDAKKRLTRTPAPCGPVARFFTSRGYTVAFPLRRGYGETGGRWAESYGRCDSADFVAGGQATADDIAAALDYLLHQPYIAKGGTVIVGQSAGGWGTLAFAARNPEGIAAFINFAGGRGGHRNNRPNSNCSPDALVASAGVFGKSTRQPTLWIYTENDSFFAKELSGRMHAAYTASGGRARYELLPAFGDDGHNLFSGKGGIEIWGPIVDRWLTRTSRP
jgi:dienelactone hydrolase